MRDTILIHDNRIILPFIYLIFKEKTKQVKTKKHYIPIYAQEILFINENDIMITIQLNGRIQHNKDIYGKRKLIAYKSDMSSDEIDEFYAWCKLNEQKIRRHTNINQTEELQK